MECTAQAFEEMQEQNIRLLEQVKEKDDANFKLMSERIKSNSVHKLLLQEKMLTQTQLISLTTEKQRYTLNLGYLVVPLARCPSGRACLRTHIYSFLNDSVNRADLILRDGESVCSTYYTHAVPTCPDHIHFSLVVWLSRAVFRYMYIGEYRELEITGIVYRSLQSFTGCAD